MSYLLAALGEVLTAKIMVLMGIGTIVGVIAAAIPGFTIAMAIILTMPFTFGMTPIEGLSTMMGVYIGGYSGGLIAGILLGIPGTPSSVATVFDGFPMTKKGQPGRALSLGVWSSFFGGLVGAATCILLAVPIARFGLRFGPWEMAALIFFALTLMASLGSRSILKGLMGGLLGLLLATVGIDPVGGRPRFTFGQYSLTSGFAFLPVLIGLFAVPAMITAVHEIQEARRKQEGGAQPFISGKLEIPWLQTLKEMGSQWFNVVRSGLIGAIVGALPAAGGNTANFLAYDQAQRFSKHPEEFGSGVPDGIVAAEAGNNGVAGGSLIPSIALGVPGNSITAVMLGVLILHGITPGPLLLRENPVLVYSVFVALVIAHFFMLAVQFVGIRAFIRVAQAPKYALVAVVLLMCVVGSFALNNRYFDVTVFAIFGLLGYLLNGAGMPMGPVVLGLILGPLAESNLRRALMTNPDPMQFFTRPISLVLIILSIASIAFSAWQIWKQEKQRKANQASISA
ncbi:MAG: tripartite tricarboxylate transporter permease [Bacillota bacterium]|jgi:putative tricarboxylic transport membrane protein